jgi:hypothetical protein
MLPSHLTNNNNSVELSQRPVSVIYDKSAALLSSIFCDTKATTNAIAIILPTLKIQ